MVGKFHAYLKKIDKVKIILGWGCEASTQKNKKRHENRKVEVRNSPEVKHSTRFLLNKC